MYIILYKFILYLFMYVLQKTLLSCNTCVLSICLVQNNRICLKNDVIINVTIMYRLVTFNCIPYHESVQHCIFSR